jgi:hypothetical protein
MCTLLDDIQEIALGLLRRLGQGPRPRPRLPALALPREEVMPSGYGDRSGSLRCCLLPRRFPRRDLPDTAQLG